jgi:trans-aconitate 2-methyltransferase
VAGSHHAISSGKRALGASGRKPAIAGLTAEPQPRPYAFGDGELAAARLGLLHEVYAPSSRALLADAVTRAPRLAYDLGCGPGYTTGMVALASQATRTVGLDSSASFVAAARSRRDDALAGRYLEFVTHDVLTVPFPAGPADLIYCRLLLAHLPDPAGAIRRWASQLTDNGQVVVDEIEWIETSHPLLRAHLRLAELMVAASGARMCAGPLLASAREGAGPRARLDRIAEVPVPTATAARLFGMNLAATGDRPVILGLCSASDLASLRSGLAELTVSAATGSAATGQITWGMRQAAYSR